MPDESYYSSLEAEASRQEAAGNPEIAAEIRSGMPGGEHFEADAATRAAAGIPSEKSQLLATSGIMYVTTPDGKTIGTPLGSKSIMVGGKS